MNFVINKTHHPIYMQLYTQLREKIISGAYGYQSRLPSKRLLAEEIGVSTITVEHAYELLCEEGYVQARQRSGYFVIFRPVDGFAFPPKKETGKLLWEADQLREKEETVGFSFSILGKTMRRILSEYQEKIFERSPNQGCVQLREALRQYLFRNRGICAEVDQIVIGSGAEYLYGMLVKLFGRNHVFAIETPSYQKIEQVYGSFELTLERLPLTKEGIESQALAAAKADILHTTPYRSFPSGVTASASKRHEYLSWASEGERYIIEDDYESEFSISSKPVETLFAMSKQDNVVYMNTFSQTISASLRVGYMVIPQKLIEAFKEKLGFYSCTVPVFEQYVLAELIRGGDFERHINRVRREIRNRESSAR